MKIKYTRNWSIEDKLVFWTYPDPNTGCFLWGGSKNPDGYGQIFIAGKLLQTHRFIFEREIGPIPEGHYILHKCDNPACINPRHLFSGTQKENMVDCSKKHRFRDRKGENSNSAKLDKHSVLRIRELIQMGKLSQTKIAEMFGVAQAQISKIKLGQTWASI